MALAHVGERGEEMRTVMHACYAQTPADTHTLSCHLASAGGSYPRAMRHHPSGRRAAPAPGATQHLVGVLALQRWHVHFDEQDEVSAHTVV
jgi:hypothetical protein